jgi:hypothetical protein
MSKNFGYESNGKTCSCGRHHGIGEITPEQRAARAARMRDTLPECMPQSQRDYLENWEFHHGKARYRMVQNGIKSGFFVKENKNMDMFDAELITNLSPPHGTQNIYSRADIYS